MNRTFMQDYLRKVNKVIAGILLLLTIIVGYFAITEKMTYLLGNALVLVVMVGFVMYTIYKKRLELISAYVVSISLIVSSLFSLNGSESMFMILLPIGVSALYMNKKLFIICSLIGNFGFLLKEYFMQNLNSDLITSLIMIDIIVLVLFFLTKWGTELVEVAAKEGQRAKVSLNELSTTMSLIEENTLSLNKDIQSADQNLHMVKEVSTSMTTTVQEVATGVIGQAESISHISEMMSDADEKVLKTQEISKRLGDVSSTASGLVSEGSEKISNMDNQISIISEAVTSSLVTVNELQDNIKEVNNFLSGINEIAEQTNLLALNAAIEAARAGESGKGFAVVADEVRKLAEQSANTVKQISQIINDVNAKTKNVIEKVENGHHATKEGERIVSEVTESFKSIQHAFNEIDEYVYKELEMIKETSSIFSEIRSEAEDIASIAEEQSAATEEMLATMENQNSNVESIYNSMQEIRNSSERLSSRLKK